MSRWASDAAWLCRRAPNAQAIRIGDITVRGPVEEADRVVLDASGTERLARVTVAVVPTDAFSSITRHGTATVGTTRYTIRDVRLLDDGALTELTIAAVVS